jgi:putative transcriptional regulator
MADDDRTEDDTDDFDGMGGMGGGLRGRLLVATPMLEDPNFRRAVVLILEHNEEGAIGVVLNRPSQAPLAEALPAWQLAVSDPRVVFVGGPVQRTAALGLGWVPHGMPDGGLRVLGDCVGTLDLDSDPHLLPLAGARVFAGYAGWGAGQLEAEIATGSWYVIEALPADAFTEEPERLWRVVLRRQGGNLAMVSLFPDDPTLN